MRVWPSSMTVRRTTGSPPAGRLASRSSATAVDEGADALGLAGAGTASAARTSKLDKAAMQAPSAAQALHFMP